MTLYADILFAVNLIMNGFILWIVSKLTRRKRKIRWVLFGASIMAFLYTLLVVLESLRFMNVAIASILILAIGVVVTFHPQGVKPFFKLMLVAYSISFTLGGLGMALMFLTDIPYAVHHIANDWEGFTRAISWQLAFVGMVISYAMIKLTMKMIERHQLKRQMLCNVKIFMGERDTTFEALVDTGHNLREPLSQSPVIIAEFEHIKSFLPDGLKVLFYEKQENDLSILAHDLDKGAFYSRIRMIPFTSLGRTNGMLVGFRPDKVMLEGTKPLPTDVIIGIYNNKLCQDGRYQGLLSPELVS